jgi:Arc/MetJ-type ribon-helix-helix transcriptional regulator
MPATESFTITISKEIADAIRAKVASGEYASESDYVCEKVLLHLAETSSESDAGWGPSDDWIVKHALPALEALDADPSSGVPLEEVEAELQRRREARQAQAA